MNETLKEIAARCKDKPPSGLFILHTEPRDYVCKRCGRVTQWHQCRWHLPSVLMPKIKRLRA